MLSEKFEGKGFAIFLKKVSIHKTLEVKEVYKRLKITPIFNISCSPDFNGIESYFSIVKSEYKKLAL